MEKKKKIIKYITINIFIFVVICLLYKYNKKICLVYNIFKIPCSGCGLTRAIFTLANGDIKESIKYNIIAIPLIIFYILYNLIYILDIIQNKNRLDKWINKYKKILIFVTIIITIISEIKNILNPLLYN